MTLARRERRPRFPTYGQVQAEMAKRQADAVRRDAHRDVEASVARCTGSLAQFVREAWHVLEPDTPYVHGWHIDAICAHLEAISRGTFLAMGLRNRLLINVPPGSMKSLLVNVFWPAWEWGPLGKPSMRYITTSFSETFVKRDNRRMRALITSDWYQARWGAQVKLTRFGEFSFENTKTGTRDGIPFGSLTGGRGDRVIADDPHSTETAESDAERSTTVRIFRESFSLRVNDPEKSALIVIMQRLHANDVSGSIKDLDLGYIHLMLPMEFEPERRCVTPIFKDPRTYDGELLFPERFTREAVDAQKKDIGPYATAGQLQQRPSLRAGGMFKRIWFADRMIPEAEVPKGTRWVRHWDLAASKAKRNMAIPRTAGVKMGKTPDGRYIVAHVIKTQDEGHNVRKLIKTTAESDGTTIEISLPQDPGQAGKVQKQDLIAMLAGFNAHAEPETGDKETRAEPFQAQCAAGNVSLVKGEWNESYIDELCEFPAGKYKDQVDASSGAFARLTTKKQRTFGIS